MRMVISAKGCSIEPFIYPELGRLTKPIKQRPVELPILRCGTNSVKKSNGKALRIAIGPENKTITRSSPRKSNFHCNTVNNGYNKSARRVRFNLPDADGDVDRNVVRSTVEREATVSERRATSVDRCSVNARRGKSSKNKRREFSWQRRDASVAVTASPGVGQRIYPTGSYYRGRLSPTAVSPPRAEATSVGLALVRAAKEADDPLLGRLLHQAVLSGVSEGDINASDCSGRTILSYIASNGSIDLLEQILQLSGLDPNKPDNEGNTPLHFVAQAGQIECLNCMLTRCRGIEIDARNNLGFTPLMKAALQGRNKCAKLLLFAGANPTLRDSGRGFRADQWARYCGRYACADVIERHARQRLLERSTSYGKWGAENELAAQVFMGKVVPVPQAASPPHTSHSIKSKLRRVFRTSSGPHPDTFSSARLVTQLTSAALCASSPVLPSGNQVPPVVKSLIRPLTVPRLQITLVNNNGDFPNNNLNNNMSSTRTQTQAQVKNTTEKEKKSEENPPPVVKPPRSKKKK